MPPAGTNIIGVDQLVSNITMPVMTFATTSATILMTSSGTVTNNGQIVTSPNPVVWNSPNEVCVLWNLNTITTGISSTQLTWTVCNQSLVNMREATAEEVARVQEQYRRHTEEQMHFSVERSLANARAEKLLQKNLSPKQREELAANGFFTLETIAKSGERRIYRIRRGRSQNVEQVDLAGQRIKTLCAHPVELVPDADTMLGQKLMLEACEDEFLRIANHS